MAGSLLAGLACLCLTASAGWSEGTADGVRPARADSVADEGKAGEARPQDFEEQLRIKRQLALEARTEVPGVQQWERRKKTWVAMVSALAFPGLGQLYNGRKIKGIIAFSAETWLIMNLYVNQAEARRARDRREVSAPGSLQYRLHDAEYEFYRSNAIDFGWFLGAFFVIDLIDVFVDANLYDFQPVTAFGLRGSGNDVQMSASISIGF